MSMLSSNLVNDLAGILTGEGDSALPGNPGADGVILRSGVISSIDLTNNVALVTLSGTNVPCVMLNNETYTVGAIVTVAVYGASYYVLGNTARTDQQSAMRQLGAGSAITGTAPSASSPMLFQVGGSSATTSGSGTFNLTLPKAFPNALSFLFAQVTFLGGSQPWLLEQVAAGLQVQGMKMINSTTGASLNSTFATYCYFAIGW